MRVEGREKRAGEKALALYKGDVHGEECAAPGEVATVSHLSCCC